MKSRVKAKTIELLDSGKMMSKFDIASSVHCVPRSANDAIRKIRAERSDVRIVGWQQIYHQRIPVYAVSNKPDAPKPAAITNKERMRRYRKEFPDRMEREAIKKRVRRQAEMLGFETSAITVHRMD